MLAIYKRELKSYFHSMTGCVFIAFLVMFTGIYFMAYNLNAGYPYFSYTLSGSLFVFIVGIPLLTMRSFSEERRNKTGQLLLTAPVPDPGCIGKVSGYGQCAGNSKFDLLSVPTFDQNARKCIFAGGL